MKLGNAGKSVFGTVRGIKFYLKYSTKKFLCLLFSCAIMSFVRVCEDLSGILREIAKAFRYYTYKEVRQMSRKCEVCGKGQVSGNNVSHSNRHTRRKWNANVQTVRIEDNGTVRKAKVCTRCLRSGKVNRAI